MKRKLIGAKPFEFSARVTMQLGRESISSSTVAISELIKNSYDADATNVTVNFYNCEKPMSTLVITDNGDGMSLDALFENWLKIGTDNKSVIGRSGKSRVLTGAKGLGRLGIDRLCRRLVLYTKTEDMKSALQLNINWKRFENTDASLSEIEHEIYEVQLPIKDKYGEVFIEENSSGSRMVLLGLKDDWDNEFIETLKNELRLLISPYKARNQFSIDIAVENKKERISTESFLNAALWKVSASIDEGGFVSASYLNKRKNDTIKQEKTEWGKWINGYGESPAFGPVKIEFHYMLVTNKSVLENLKIKSKDFKSFMKLNRGLRIYRDHFRVRPYGEPSGKGDWLDLGYRRASSPGGIAQGGWRIGPNQIIGAVLISREKNSALDDQANREGILENDAFFQLRAFILKIISNFEEYAHKDAAAEKTAEPTEELSELVQKSQEEADEAAQKLKNSINRPKSTSKKKQLSMSQKVKMRLKDFEQKHAGLREASLKLEETLKAEKLELEVEKELLSNLASLGILTVCFGHEIRQQSSQAAADALEISELINEASGGMESFDHDSCILRSRSIRDNLNYINNFSNLALQNVSPDKRKRKKINVPEIFKYVFEMLDNTFDTMGITTEIVINKAFEKDYNVMAFEIDLESIAMNLVTNSIWAVGFKPRAERKIFLVFDMPSSDMIEIKYADSGRGLETGTEEVIFSPLHSTKRDREGNTTGTGMGLAIIRNQVENHMKGKVKAVAKNDRLGGAEFIFTIPVA